jgi:hypothetical protein
VFAADPPVPHGSDQAEVVQFGRLSVAGDGARLGIVTLCGALCSEGATLRLRFSAGRWRVAGTVGPRWVS